MKSSFLNRDQALSLWSGSSDSKTLDYQRTNPAAAAAKSLQSCPTLCDPIDGSPPGFPAPGILQARTLEWVAIAFSNAWKWKVKVKLLSHVRLLATPWTAGYQAPPSMGFSRQEYWSGVPLPSLTQSQWLSFSSLDHFPCALKSLHTLLFLTWKLSVPLSFHPSPPQKPRKERVTRKW